MTSDVVATALQRAWRTDDSVTAPETARQSSDDEAERKAPPLSTRRIGAERLVERKLDALAVATPAAARARKDETRAAAARAGLRCAWSAGLHRSIGAQKRRTSSLSHCGFAALRTNDLRRTSQNTTTKQTRSIGWRL